MFYSQPPHPHPLPSPSPHLITLHLPCAPFYSPQERKAFVGGQRANPAFPESRKDGIDYFFTTEGREGKEPTPPLLSNSGGACVHKEEETKIEMGKNSFSTPPVPPLLFLMLSTLRMKQQKPKGRQNKANVNGAGGIFRRLSRNYRLLSEARAPNSKNHWGQIQQAY